MSTPQFSIIIPNYNGHDLLAANLPVLFDVLAAEPVSAEVIVVDDGSADASTGFLSTISHEGFRYITHDKNLGFATACLTGAQAARGQLLYLLNTDIKVTQGFLAALAPLFADTGLFAAASMAMDGRGKKIVAARNSILWRCGQPEIVRHGPFTGQGRSAGRTFFASGGHAAFDREKFLALGGFSRAFSPYYWEDIDLSYRAWKRGWHIAFEPRSVVLHDHGATISSTAKREQIEQIWRHNRFAFIWRNTTSPLLFAQHILSLALYLPLMVAAQGLSLGLSPFTNALKHTKEIRNFRKSERSAPVGDATLYRLFTKLLDEKPVRVCCIGNGSELEKEVIDRLECCGIQAEPCGAAYKGRLTGGCMLLLNYFLRVRGRCHVIFAGNINQGSAWAVRLIAKLTGAKIISAGTVAKSADTAKAIVTEIRKTIAGKL